MFAELLRDLAAKVESVARADTSLARILQSQGIIMAQLDDLNSKIDALGAALDASKSQTDTLLLGITDLRDQLAAAQSAGTQPDLSGAIAHIDALTAGVQAETAKEVTANTPATPAAPVTPVTPDPTAPVATAPVVALPDPVTAPPAGVSPVVLPVTTPTAPVDTATAATAATADAAAIPVGTVPVTDEQKTQASPSIDSGATVHQSVTDTNPLAPVATTVPGGDGTTPA